MRSLDIVEDVKRIQEPFKLANRKFHPEDTAVKVGGVTIGAGHFTYIAGPCSVETEKQIQESLKHLDFPCTKVIIAQRISTTKAADKILVLQDGRITEAGSHEELLAKKGYYYELVRLQTGIDDAVVENSTDFACADVQ